MWVCCAFPVIEEVFVGKTALFYSLSAWLGVTSNIQGEEVTTVLWRLRRSHKQVNTHPSDDIKKVNDGYYPNYRYYVGKPSKVIRKNYTKKIKFYTRLCENIIRFFKRQYLFLMGRCASTRGSTQHSNKRIYQSRSINIWWFLRWGKVKHIYFSYIF